MAPKRARKQSKQLKTEEPEDEEAKNLNSTLFSDTCYKLG